MRRLFFLALLLAPGAAFSASYYGGQTKNHGHTNTPGDGGPLVNPIFTGTVNAPGGTFAIIKSSSLPVNVKETPYSATGNGTTNDRTAVQTALTAVAGGLYPNKLVFPFGSYKINSGLTIDGTMTSIECYGATLDFSLLAATDTAITFTTGVRGYAGQPYLNAANSLKGCTIVGPSQTSGAVGISFAAVSDPGAAHYELQDNNIYLFETGVLISSNSYLVRMIHNNIFASGKCLSIANVTNAGEGIIFTHGACFNSSTGVYLVNGNADVYVDNSSFDGIYTNYFYHSGGGGMNVTNTHIEGNFAPDYTRAQIYLSTGQVRNMAVFSNDWVLIKSTHSLPAFDLEGLACEFRMTDSYINGTASVSSATIRANVVGGKATLMGNYSTMNDTFFQNTSSILYWNVNDQTNAGDIGHELNIKGIAGTKTTGAGNVGERITSIIGLGSSISAAASGTVKQLTTAVLTPGEWRLHGYVCGSTNVIGGYMGYGYSDAGGSSTSGYVQGITAGTVVTSTNTDTCAVLPAYEVGTLTSTTVYLKFYFNYSSGVPTSYGFLEGERIQR